MSAAKNTKAIPVDEIVIGTQFIPAGKKMAVEVFRIGDGTAASIDLYCTSARGVTAHIVSRYTTVEAIIPARS